MAIVSSSGFQLSRCECLPQEGAFDCGDPDLNEYFSRDAEIARRELLAITYELTFPETPDEPPISYVSLCNDSIELRHIKERCTFPDGKGYRWWPAVKIARLGTRKEWQGGGAGTTVLNLIKELFVTDNRTGCRMLTVDAYNNPRTLAFYERNEFSFLHDKDVNRATRAMFYDLTRLKL